MTRTVDFQQADMATKRVNFAIPGSTRSGHSDDIPRSLQSNILACCTRRLAPAKSHSCASRRSHCIHWCLCLRGGDHLRAHLDSNTDKVKVGCELMLAQSGQKGCPELQNRPIASAVFTPSRSACTLATVNTHQCADSS